MAVETTATSASFTGTGVASTYAPGFYVNSSDQVAVTVDGVLQTLGDDYVVNNVGASTGCDIVGTFTLGSAIYVERVTPITQLVDTRNNETILEDVLDAEFDKLTMIAQELSGKADRAILFPKGESGYTLPAPATRASRFLGFNAFGAIALLLGTATADVNATAYQRSPTATIRTIKEKLDNDTYVSVRDFGAVGDGVTDDLPAFNKAVAYAKTLPRGCVIHVPFGNFRLSGPLVIDGGGIILEGQGPLATTLTFSSATTDGIYFNGTAGVIYYGGVTRMKIAHSGVKTAGIAIRMYKVSQYVIERVSIDDPWIPLDLKSFNNVTVRDVLAAGVRGPYGCKGWSTGDGTERSDVLSLIDTVFDMSPGAGDGLVVDGAMYTVRARGFGILNATRAFYCRNTAGSGSYFPQFIEFEDAEFDGTLGSTIVIEGGSNIQFVGCDFFNLATATGPIVNISADIGGSYTNTINITGGRIYGGQRQAVVITARDWVITGAQIGGGNSAGYACIEVGTNAQDFIIANNKIGVIWGSFISKYTYGVSVAATTYRGLVQGNGFYGCLNDYFNGSTTGSVMFGSYLGFNGTVNPIDESYSTGALLRKVKNSSNGAAAQAAEQLETGQANTYTRRALVNNTGAPYRIDNGGTAVTIVYEDFDTHVWRSNGSVEKGLLDTSGFKLPTGRGYYVNNQQVVGARQGAITSPSGGATIDSQARAAIDAIRAALTAHGLTA